MRGDGLPALQCSAIGAAAKVAVFVHPDVEANPEVRQDFEGNDGVDEEEGRETDKVPGAGT